MDPTQEEQQQLNTEILTNEDGLLRGLLEAAQTRVTDVRTIEIRRNGKSLFTFRVRGLSEAEFNECSDKATKYERAKNLGVKIPVDTNQADYRSWLIYTATVNEDRAKLWDNQQAKQQLGVLSGKDVIERVLNAGEKARVVELIQEASGYADQDDLEETAKNS